MIPRCGPYALPGMPSRIATLSALPEHLVHYVLALQLAALIPFHSSVDLTFPARCHILELIFPL